MSPVRALPPIASLMAIVALAAPSASVARGCVQGPHSKCPSAQLSGQDFKKRNLARSDFRSAWLVEARMRRVRLTSARLKGADLSRALIADSTMTRLNPGLHRGSGMRFLRARLLRVRLNGNLQGADFTGARVVGDLSGANLARASFRGARLRGIDLRDTNLTRARFDGADLRGADLRGANLTHASLDHARLRGARLAGARLVHTDLGAARAQGADLERALVYDADFTLAKLVGAQLGFYAGSSAALGPAWIASAELFPRVFELAGRACRTQIDPPVLTTARPPGSERRLSAKLEGAHDRFRRRNVKRLAKAKAGRAFSTTANTVDSGCGSGRQAALGAAAGGGPRNEASFADRLAKLLSAIDRPSAALRDWLDLVVRRS
jgi:uncharacterized protein YjbI with pentapeptide repeats